MKLKHLLIGMLAFVAAVSCKEDQPVETPTLKVSETSLSFAAEGGEKSFNLTANLDWTATPDADWLSVEPTSGKGSDKATAIKVTADENTTAEARTATVKVKAGALSETISVTQAKKEATEPEQPEQPKAATIKDFVKEYVKIIDVWTNNVGVVNVVGGVGAKNDANDVQNAHYVPDDTKVVVGDVEYTLADAVELASRSYLLLRGYDGNDTKTFGRNLPIAKLEKAYTLDDALPATHSYTWGQYPYAERTNGGDFKMVTSEGAFELMKVDILDDYSHRHTNFPGQGGALSNFCAYTGGYLAGYDGCCCVKRIMMAYAHFFKYMLDNNLQDATGVSADQTFDAPLFGVPAEPEQPEPSVPAIEAGPYWIMGTKDNVTKVMSPLAAEKNYGYAPSEEAVDGKSYAKNVFTFAAVEGGFTIADASGRYYYQEKGTTYKTFNAGTDGKLPGCVWTVAKNADETYTIVNKESGKTIRYAEDTYTSFGVYTDEEANGSVLVNLVKADSPLEDKPAEPEQPAVDVPWTVGTAAYSDLATIDGTANVPVLKLGKSDAVGTATIKIPAGTTTVKFSAVAWKGKSTKLTFSAEGLGTIHEVTLKGNDGATSTAPYTITTDGSEVQNINVYALVANINNGTPAPLPTELVVTVTTDATNYRAILWGFEFGTDIPTTPEQPKAATIKDFATEYVKLIDVWQANVGTVNYLKGVGEAGDANDMYNAHYIPENTKVTVDGKEYNLADVLELAERSYLLVRGWDGNSTTAGKGTFPTIEGTSMDTELSETHKYAWGASPYNETGKTEAGNKVTGNGGGFRMGDPNTLDGVEAVKLDVLDNFAQRHVNYPIKNSAISNMCGYSTGQLAGYYGCFSAKRALLTYAYFFKYMLDNNLTDAKSISADQTFNTYLFGPDATAEKPQQPEQPQEPVVLAEWLFTKANLNTYADSFGGTKGVKDNTAGDGGMRIAANVSGTGYISYVQIDKTALDPDKKVQRTVGSTGHPYATGGWVGDYWLFTFGDKAIAKSSKVSIKYITRSSKTGMKYWRLEYLDGTEWKPAMATKTVKLTDGTEVDCNIEMNADGSTNVEVDVVVEYANDTAEPCFRMLSLSVEKAEGTGPLEAINTGTSRIAGAEGTSPVITLISAPTK